MSVTRPAGFKASGVAIGIKDGAVPDLAVVSTEEGQAVAAAGVFTSNLAAAAPVQVSREHLAATAGRAAAVILNSGNANAATGKTGRRHARRMAELTAAGLGCATEEVLVCSTGLIGFYLPAECLETGVPAAIGALASSEDAGWAAARAIMTTDTRMKTTDIDGGGFRIGGMAKGAAMLAPNMATMLAVLTTDAGVEPGELATALRRAVAGSFNEMTLDGATSTNDTVLVLASGRAGPAPIARLEEALGQACEDLASQMAADAEGGTRVATIRVTGAASRAEAAIGARKVAESQLVQCSLHGGDPYWGRIVSELGSAGIAFDIDRVSVAYGGVVVCRDGVAVEHDRDSVRAHMQGIKVEVSADLGLGTEESRVVTRDLTAAYIAENERTS
ncbi:MAG: bifunctional glutamate N-acetyltransferase/amino-acid acetyltransferase ArgJ [Acidimicrobiales bacterium]